MPSTDTVSSITNCYRLIVSYSDPVHSFMMKFSSRNAQLSQLGLVRDDVGLRVMVMMFMAREVAMVTNPYSGGQGDLYNSSGGQGESPCCETLEAEVERR